MSIVDTRKKALVFGASGKLGTALCSALKDTHRIETKSSADIDITVADQVARCIEASAPHVVFNAAAFVGIDACEQDPHKAFAANALFPKLLATLSNHKDFLLVHISTDGVFNGQKKDFYSESDRPQPLNVYGMTKYSGDCFVQAIAERYYVFRIPLLFGRNDRNNQFVEKMLLKIRAGDKRLQISDDIVTSPSHSLDIAQAMAAVMASDTPFGLYHMANEGRVSLHALIRQVVEELDLDVDIQPCSHERFPSLAIKNTYTPIKSEHLDPLRPWKQALSDYCKGIGQEVKDE